MGLRLDWNKVYIKDFSRVNDRFRIHGVCVSWVNIFDQLVQIRFRNFVLVLFNEGISQVSALVRLLWTFKGV